MEKTVTTSTARGDALDLSSKIKSLVKKSGPAGRYQVEFDNESIDFIDRLSTALGIKTRRQTIDDAVTLFAWVISEKQKGRTLASVDPEDGTFREYLLNYRALIGSEQKVYGNTSTAKTASSTS